VSEEFGTVSVRRSDHGREIELLRQRYRQHRESLMRLVSDAPTEHLATEYHRLVRDIDTALSKIDEIEGRGPAAAPTVPGTATAGTVASATVVPPAVPPRGATPVSRAQGVPLHDQTEPGNRTLIPPPGAPHEGAGAYEAPPSAGSRVTLIALAAIVVLALIGWLIWRASSERKAQPAAVALVTDSAPMAAPVTPAPQPPASLTITPAVVDFGTVGKGTRAARQLEITNNTPNTIAIQASRSQCRCLFYEYADKIAPKKKETVTVTVDGARAKAGTLDETITIRAKKDPTVSTTFQVTGAVK
jgi:Protein of unknown function (DUF1573)